MPRRRRERALYLRMRQARWQTTGAVVWDLQTGQVGTEAIGFDDLARANGLGLGVWLRFGFEAWASHGVGRFLGLL